MLLKKLFTVFLMFTFLLAGCAGKNRSISSNSVGPQASSALSRQNDSNLKEPVEQYFPKPDVIIPVFDPGLPENLDDAKKKNIWPELRRAEVNRFALKLKKALDDTNRFGAVRVTPDSSATGDLYILGKIEKSNGAEVEIRLSVIDISGRMWLEESYEHEVPESFYQDTRNKEKDPYDPVFKTAAKDIVEELKSHDKKELDDLHYLANIRFGASFSDAAFGQYMEESHGKINLVAKPSEDDPMYRRIKAIRVRDQLFIDAMQDNYSAFSDQMAESYRMWQEQSQIELRAGQAADRAKWGNAAGGALLIGLSVLSALAGSNSDSNLGSAAGTTGAIVGGMAGAEMIRKSFQSSEEAKMHREAINELGQSVDMELAPRVVAFEEKTVQLTGDAKEQFDQWRNFLKKIYAQEKTPDVQL